MKIVMVEWVDSTMLGSRWHCEDEINQLDIGKCVAVGIVRKDDNNKLVLTQNQAVYKDGANLIAIPKPAITRMRRLYVRLMEDL